MLALITANEAWVQVPRHDPIPAGRPCLEDPAPGVEADDLPFEMDTGPFKDVRPDGPLLVVTNQPADAGLG